MRMNRMGMCLLALSAGVASGRVVNVADHGIRPGSDVTYKVNRLLEELRAEESGSFLARIPLIGNLFGRNEELTLYFPQGRYEFRPDLAVEQYRAVTNHDNSLRRMAIPLFGLENFTLDGGGSTFVFHGRISPVVVDRSDHITLKNFTIDWDTPFHHELTVVERDEKTNSFIAEISPLKYGFAVKGGELLLGHYDWQDTLGQNVPYDPQTGAPYWETHRFTLNQQSDQTEKVSNSRVRLTNATKMTPPIGAVICTYGNKPTNRLAQAIHIASSSNVYVEEVTVHAAGGMALIAERVENIHLNRFVVTAAEGRTLSTRADATHFLGCKGLVKVENCRLEHMSDDGINVHGAYVKVAEYRGDNTFLCEISHPQQKGFIFCEAGDKVMLTSRVTVLPLFESTVRDVKVLNESRFLMTLDKMPETLPEGPLSVENLTWYPDLDMRNNIIRANRARSALISTKGDVLIENNYFSSQKHGVLMEGDNKAWYESGGVRNVVINNNVFENVGFGIGTGYPLYAAPLLLPNQTTGDDQYHWNIRFTNNKINSFNGHVAYAFNVKNLVIVGNVITLDSTYPAGTKLPVLDFDFCDNVRVQNNQFSGFTDPIRLESKANVTGLTVENNLGLSK